MLFNGELTWDSAREFVVAVDAHLEQYFYRRIEVVVSSPGGHIAALKHKGELAPVLERTAPKRLEQFRAEVNALNLMAGERWPLDTDLAAGRWIRKLASEAGIGKRLHPGPRAHRCDARAML